MPHRYEGIKRSMREKYPNAPLEEIKTRASKIYESTRKPGEIHIQTAAKRERHRKVGRGN